MDRETAENVAALLREQGVDAKAEEVGETGTYAVLLAINGRDDIAITDAEV